MANSCMVCGHVNDDDSRFCSSCGVAIDLHLEVTGAIPLVADGDTGEISLAELESMSILPAGSAVLVVRKGALEGVRFPLDATSRESISIGRAPESTIFLDDVTVSRKHAQVSYRDGKWSIADSGSLNGTYVNRERVDNGVLNDQDEVQVGKYRFIFLSSAADA